MFPKHLKLNAVLSTLDGPEAIGRSPAAPRLGDERTIAVPVFLKRWPRVQDALKSLGVPFNWVWALVRRLMQRIANLFGVRMNAPEQPPGAFDPAVELVSTADGAAAEPAAAQNLADAASYAAAQRDEFLKHLLSSLPDREALKDGGAPAFLAAALQALGTHLAQLRETERELQANFKRDLDAFAQSMGVEPLHALRLARADHTNGAFAQLSPLWRELQEHRAQMGRVTDTFCDYCVLAMRKPDGMEQAAVEQVVTSAMQLYADADMQQRIKAGIAAPSLESGMASAERADAAQQREPSGEHDPMDVAAKEAFSGPAAAKSDAAPEAEGRADSFKSMMDRFRSAGVLDDGDDDEPSHKPAA